MSAGRVVAAAAAVGFVGLATWRLRTGRPARAALGLGVALLLSLYAAGERIALPAGDNAVEDAADALGAWTYPFVAGMAFLETAIPPVTLIFPGEFAVLLGGAIAGEGRIEIVPLILLVWVCSLLGDSFTFALGRRLGRPFLLRSGGPLGMTEERLGRLDGWFDRYGAPAVAFGRLLPLARPFGPFVAGSSRFPYGRFLRWNAVGTLAFSLLFCLLGYAFYNSYDAVADTVGTVAFILLVAIVAGVVAFLAIRRRRAAAARAAEEGVA
jgi:membrane protein DedA with SNARE-associated domain